MEMYEYLESKDDKGRLQWRQVVVTGTESGVGTSMFLVYYLLRFVSHSAYLLVTGLRAYSTCVAQHMLEMSVITQWSAWLWCSLQNLLELRIQNLPATCTLICILICMLLSLCSWHAGLQATA